MLGLGRTLGPYELVEVLGRGGFAVVWLARRIDGRPPHGLVALKTVHPDATVDAKLLNMLVTEACVASRIDHPNVARALELGDANGVLYLAMEYVEGDTLSSLARAATDAGLVMPIEVVVGILADVCAGLHAAHELRENGELVGVVHRDVSPQNILVGSSGTVKLVDFGIAKARTYSMSETTAGIAKGKRRYMAPEQVTAQPLDRRVDVWATGAVAYELLEGRPVHDGPNEMARLHSLVHAATVGPFTAPVPPPVASVLYRALARDPEERYPTAAALREALLTAAAESGHPVTRTSIASFVESLAMRESESGRRNRLTEIELPRPRRGAAPGSTVLFTAPAMPVPPRVPTPPDTPLPGSVDSATVGASVGTPTRITGGRSWRYVAVAATGLALGIAAIPVLPRRNRATVDAAPPAEPPVVETAAAITAPPSASAAFTATRVTAAPLASATAPAVTANSGTAATQAPPPAPQARAASPAPRKPQTPSRRTAASARSELLDDTIE